MEFPPESDALALSKYSHLLEFYLKAAEAHRRTGIMFHRVVKMASHIMGSPD
jgi:hypothetical protein